MGKINYTEWLAQVDADLNEALQNKKMWDATVVKLQQLKASLEAFQKTPALDLSFLFSKPLANVPALNLNLPATGVGTPLSLQQLAGANLFDDYGLTSATRAVLALNANEWLSATEVKDHLDAQKFDWSNYTQPMAALHTVLKRLAVRELETTQAMDGVTLFKKRPIPLPRKRRKFPHRSSLHPSLAPALPDPMTTPPVEEDVAESTE